MQSFQLIKPCLALAPYIRHYWILQDDSVTPVSERTLPIGCMQLVFHKGKQCFDCIRLENNSNHFYPTRRLYIREADRLSGNKGLRL